MAESETQEQKRDRGSLNWPVTYGWSAERLPYAYQEIEKIVFREHK